MAEGIFGFRAAMASFAWIKQTFRQAILAILSAARRVPAGRAAARFGRNHMPRAYAMVLRRYHAYSHLKAAPRGRSAPRLSAVPPAGLSPQENFVFRRLALAAHLARRPPGAG